jgi:hypothetical protein
MSIDSTFGEQPETVLLENMDYNTPYRSNEPGFSSTLYVRLSDGTLIFFLLDESGVVRRLTHKEFYKVQGDEVAIS